MAANNSNRGQVEKQIADAEKYLEEYKRGNLTMVVSNLKTSKIERKIKKLKEQLASMPKPPEATVTKPTIVKPKVAPSPNTRGGNIGRTTTKYDTPKGKAKVAAKPKAEPKKKPATKKKVGQSGMGMNAYQNLNYNRRK